MKSALSAGASDSWLVVAVVLVAIGMFGCVDRASAAPARLGPPDTPPVPATTTPSVPTAAATPTPTTDATPAPTPEPTPEPVAPPTTATPPAPTGATTTTTAPDDAAALARARAVQLERRAAARRERGRRFAAAIHISAGVGDDLRAAAAAVDRAGATSKRSPARTPVSTPAAGAADDRASNLTLLLLALSGFTAGIALLPMRSARRGRQGPTLAFVERHRLELAGVSSSCLLVALLVFVGLI